MIRSRDTDEALDGLLGQDRARRRLAALVGAVLLVLMLALVLGPPPAHGQGSTSGRVTYSRQSFAEGAFGAYSKSNCAVLVSALRRQGASPSVAYRLGHTIAWRESGCSMQCVSNRTDLSCSRFGINFRFRGASGAWDRLCGADSHLDTRALAVDVKCAYAAYRTLGWRPWR